MSPSFAFTPGLRTEPKGPSDSLSGGQRIGPIGCRRKPQAKGRVAVPTVPIRPRMPGLALYRACRGQAGAAGFVAGQIRQTAAAFRWF